MRITPVSVQGQEELIKIHIDPGDVNAMIVTRGHSKNTLLLSFISKSGACVAPTKLEMGATRAGPEGVREKGNPAGCLNRTEEGVQNRYPTSMKRPSISSSSSILSTSARSSSMLMVNSL